MSVSGNVVVQIDVRIASKKSGQTSGWGAVVVGNAQNQPRRGSVAGGNGVERAMEFDADESQQSNGDVLAMVATQQRVRIDGRRKPKRIERRQKWVFWAKFGCVDGTKSW